MLVTFASLRGSPGVTTATVGFAQAAAAAGWDDVLLVEADPDGAVQRFLLPHLDPDRNLLTFGVAARRADASSVLAEHAQPLFDQHVQPQTLIAPDLGAQIARALEMSIDGLVDHAQNEHRLVIVDCGRLSNVSAPLFHRGHRRMLLFGCQAHEVLSAKTLLDSAGDTAAALDLILVGDQPYGPADVEGLGVELAGTLPYDLKGAKAISGAAPVGARKYAKTPLVQALAGLLPPVPYGQGRAALMSGADNEERIDADGQGSVDTEPVGAEGRI